MTPAPPSLDPPRLHLGHTTLAVTDLDRMLRFYCDVLGFVVTDRGEPAPGAEMAFITQDPDAHHQIVLVAGDTPPARGFVMADHLAFRTTTLDHLRAVLAALDAAGTEGVIPIDHGNSWSLYFPDPEGNGLEIYVDTPFHVAQPHADSLDLTAGDDEIVATTAARVAERPGTRPMAEFRADLATRLNARTTGTAGAAAATTGGR